MLEYIKKSRQSMERLSTCRLNNANTVDKKANVGQILFVVPLSHFNKIHFVIRSRKWRSLLSKHIGIILKLNDIHIHIFTNPSNIFLYFQTIKKQFLMLFYICVSSLWPYGRKTLNVKKNSFYILVLL